MTNQLRQRRQQEDERAGGDALRQELGQEADVEDADLRIEQVGQQTAPEVGQAYSAACAGLGRRVSVHAKIDSGMGRLGVTEEAVLTRLRETPFDALEKAGIEAGQVGKVVRVGGSCRIPAFIRMLDSLFPGRVEEGEVFMEAGIPHRAMRRTL